VAAVAPVASASVAPPLPSAPPLPVQATPLSVPVSVGSAPVAANSAADHRVEALTERVDSLQKALDQANQQLEQMAHVAAAPPTKDLQDKIDKLEQQIAVLEVRPAPLAVMGGIPGTAERVSTHKVHKGAVVHAPKHKGVTFKHAKKPVEIAAKPSSKWVLRAASIGQAWIAPSADSHELKQVQIGDTLPGVGRVTAIEQRGESWLVQGTKGEIQ
jgi:intracellular multiplication protein IcmG